MKRVFKIFGIVAGLLVIIAGLMVFYIIFFLPQIDAPRDLKVELTPEKVERGKYLANEVMGCVACHGKRDFTKYAGPVIETAKTAGGEVWNHEIAFPGEMYAPNITPANLGNWTDGELFRAITCGVDKDGKPLFPIMPYLQFGKLPREDIYDVIAYLRTLKPVKNDFPQRKLDFPLNIIVHMIPASGTHNLTSDTSDPVEHGKYLVTAAACYDCHTPMNNQGKFIENLGFAGGMEFVVRTGGIVRSANLTPDKETGLGNWTRETFVMRFKAYDDASFVPGKISPGEFNTEMPWQYYAQLKEKDLQDIYAYLQSLKPIRHQVVKFTAP